MKDNKNWNVWAALGAVGAAILASSCCIGPVVLAALGAGSVGVATALTPYRPYLLGLTFFLLAGAFYATYRKPRAEACCAEGATCAMKSAHRNRTILWVVTVFVVAAAAFPQLETLRNRKARADIVTTFAAASASSKRLSFKVEGMTCGACAIHIQKELAQVPGVTKVGVSYESKEAVVEWSKNKPSEAALAKAVAEAGYKAILPSRSAQGKE